MVDQHGKEAAETMMANYADDDGVDVNDDFDFDSYGFTDEEVLELAAQGIKPGDPEARDVLEMLNSTQAEEAAGGDF